MNKYAWITFAVVIGIAISQAIIGQAFADTYDVVQYYQTACNDATDLGGTEDTVMIVTGNMTSYESYHSGTCSLRVYEDSNCTTALAGSNYFLGMGGWEGDPAGTASAVQTKFVPAGGSFEFSQNGSVGSCQTGYRSVLMIGPSSAGGGGSATSSPYIVDLGSTIMLGGILMFLIAYWIIGLIRSARSK